MRYALIVLSIVVGGCLLGCQGTATTALSAGDALDRIADQMWVTVDEYHSEVAAGDDAKESDLAAAFVSRVAAHVGDEQALATDQTQFLAALSKVRLDREVEWNRRNAAKDNVSALRDVSKGLRRIALDSLSLNDEMRRYLTGWYDTYEKAKAEREAERVANKQAQVNQRNDLIRAGVGAIAPQYSPVVDTVLGGQK